ncbi:MAG: MMPL family transporter, partial [Gammaproteobacteria bacterium]|nr:MMPL family transporter [Gammaproteobacteria bacterium]
FREGALLFLSTEELYELSDNLAKIQPFLTRLTDDMSIRGLFNMLSDAIDAIEDGEDFDIVPLLQELDKSAQSTINNLPYRVSWQNLIDVQTGNDNAIYRDFIILQPVLDQDAMLPADKAIEKIRELANSNEITSTGTTVRLTGSEVLAQEELLSVSRGTELAIILSLCLVTIIMITGIRSVRLVSYTLITLVTGLLFTAAFATFAIGELNLISVAFAVLYIGLGIDFAIHYTLRYQELINQGNSNHLAIEESSRNLGQSLIICTITTAVGFFAFVPTDYQGVAELGLISGVGMFISLFVTLTLLPAILGLFPLKTADKPTQKQASSWSSVISSFPINHSSKIKIIALLCLIAGSLAFTGVRFDHNILNLQDQENESVQTYVDLLKSSDTSPWNGVIVTDDREDAINTRRTIESSPVVDSVIWLEDFIPEDQEEKLFIIDEINLLLAGGFTNTNLDQTLSTGEKMNVLSGFIDQHNTSPLVQNMPEIASFMTNLQRLQDQLQSASPQQRNQHLDNFSTSMLASLPGRLEVLNASLNADVISLDNLPEDLTARWLSPDGNYLLSIQPVDDLNDNQAMRQFVEDLYKLDVRLTGPPVI